MCLTKCDIDMVRGQRMQRDVFVGTVELWGFPYSGWIKMRPHRTVDFGRKPLYLI